MHSHSNYNQIIEQSAHEAYEDVVNRKQILDVAYLESKFAILKNLAVIQQTERDWIQDYLNSLRISLRRYVQTKKDESTEATLENLTRYKPFNNQCPITFKNLEKNEGLALSTGRLYDPHAIAKWVFVQNKNIDPVDREPLTSGDRDRIEKYKPIIPITHRPRETRRRTTRPSKNLVAIGIILAMGLGMALAGILCAVLGAGMIMTMVSVIGIGPVVGLGILFGTLALAIKIKNCINQRRDEAQQRLDQQPSLEMNELIHNDPIEEKPSVILQSDRPIVAVTPEVPTHSVVTHSMFQKRIVSELELQEPSNSIEELKRITCR